MEKIKIKFFEWADYEEEVFNEIKNDINLETLDYTFSTNKFSVQESEGYNVISIFVDSRISNDELDRLKVNGTHTILLRCAGFNMLDTEYAKSVGVSVRRVCSYSPESIAEHVFALLLAVVRKLMTDRRKHEIGQDGRDISQMGTTLNGKKIGFYGFGKIGQSAAKIAKYGFGMDVLYFDPYFTHESKDFIKVKNLEELFHQSHVVSIHTLLNDETRRSINKHYFSLANDLILINTARGPIVHTEDMLEALKNGNLSGVGLDVVDEDDSYKNLPLQDNIVFTQHTAFFTKEAVESILRQTFGNVEEPLPQNVVV